MVIIQDFLANLNLYFSASSNRQWVKVKPQTTPPIDAIFTRPLPTLLGIEHWACNYSEGKSLVNIRYGIKLPQLTLKGIVEGGKGKAIVHSFTLLTYTLKMKMLTSAGFWENYLNRQQPTLIINQCTVWIPTKLPLKNLIFKWVNMCIH